LLLGGTNSSPVALNAKNARTLISSRSGLLQVQCGSGTRSGDVSAGNLRRKGGYLGN
jgi:hypothetical protein